jgi:hypothetical protein
MEDALAPQAHDVAAHRECRVDLVVGPTLGGEQDHLGAQNFEIRQRILARPILQVSRSLRERWIVKGLFLGILDDPPSRRHCEPDRLEPSDPGLRASRTSE